MLPKLHKHTKQWNYFWRGEIIEKEKSRNCGDLCLHSFLCAFAEHQMLLSLSTNQCTDSSIFVFLVQKYTTLDTRITSYINTV